MCVVTGRHGPEQPLSTSDDREGSAISRELTDCGYLRGTAFYTWRDRRDVEDKPRESPSTFPQRTRRHLFPRAREPRTGIQQLSRAGECCPTGPTSPNEYVTAHNRGLSLSFEAGDGCRRNRCQGSGGGKLRARHGRELCPMCGPSAGTSSFAEIHRCRLHAKSTSANGTVNRAGQQPCATADLRAQGQIQPDGEAANVLAQGRWVDYSLRRARSLFATALWVEESNTPRYRAKLEEWMVANLCSRKVDSVLR